MHLCRRLAWGILLGAFVGVSADVFAVALVGAAPAAADEAGDRPHAAGALKPPPNDPRRGPRLVYTRGATACLPEASFRDEVAILLDGVDHFDATSTEQVTVTFERLANGFRGTVVHINASGVAEPPIVKAYHSCEILGRWIAGTASGFIPGPPAPGASAAPTEGPAAAPSIAPSAVPAASNAVVASAVPIVSVSAAPLVSGSAVNGGAPPVRPFRPCVPSREAGDILMLMTCAATAVALASGGVTIGLDAHFQSMRSSLLAQGYVTSACDTVNASAECVELHGRLEGRNRALYVAAASGIVTGVLAIATTLVFLAGPAFRSSKPKAPHPSIALTAGFEGGGIDFVGAW